MSETTTAIEVHSNQSASLSFGDPSRFEHIQRVAKMMAESQLVPVVFQKNLPNVVIALEMAQRIGASPLMVMQNLNIIHGKPSFGASFMIATVNACGRFTPLRFHMVGERDGDDWGCYAQAQAKVDKFDCKGVTVTLGIAKAEGWFGKSGSKWKTMPELMLQYRAATWWVRAFAPELLMGFPTAEEVTDVDLVPADITAAPAADPQPQPEVTKRRRGGAAGMKSAEPIDPPVTTGSSPTNTFDADTKKDPNVGQTVAEKAAEIDAAKAAPTPAPAPAQAPAPAAAPTPPPAAAEEKKAAAPAPAADKAAAPAEDSPFSAPPKPTKTKRCEVVDVQERQAKKAGGVIGPVCHVTLKGDHVGMAYFDGTMDKIPSNGAIIDAVITSKTLNDKTAHIIESFTVLA